VDLELTGPQGEQSHVDLNYTWLTIPIAQFPLVDGRFCDVTKIFLRSHNLRCCETLRPDNKTLSFKRLNQVCWLRLCLVPFFLQPKTVRAREKLLAHFFCAKPSLTPSATRVALFFHFLPLRYFHLSYQHGNPTAAPLLLVQGSASLPPLSHFVQACAHSGASSVAPCQSVSPYHLIIR